jgi:N-acetylglucosamine kinase-like BadF-type ATPase
MTAVERAPALVMGIDGGNTKTIALVATLDGAIVGTGRSQGSADIHLAAVDDAIARLASAGDAALHQAHERVARDREAGRRARDAGLPPGVAAVAAVALSLAGADWPEDFATIEERLGGRWGPTTIVNDAIGALRAAIPDGPGVIVVCGTGAVTGARGIDGRTWHSSFWQLAQGAHELGVQGLHAVVRAELGIGPPTALTARILGAFGEPTVEAVLHRLTGRETRARREHSSIAPLVLDAADAGDPVAAAIVQRHGADLGRFAVAAARRVGIEDSAFPLALAGGVLRHPGRRLIDALTAEVLAAAPGARVSQADLEPAAGALLLAFDAAGVSIDTTTEATIRGSMPPPDLFDTHPARAQ